MVSSDGYLVSYQMKRVWYKTSNEFDDIICDDVQPQPDEMNNSGVTEHNMKFVDDMEITDDLHVVDPQEESRNLNLTDSERLTRLWAYIMNMYSLPRPKLVVEPYHPPVPFVGQSNAIEPYKPIPFPRRLNEVIMRRMHIPFPG